ncbi:calcium/sodium antiporter [Pleomorphochaeta sp. DL1XJH-081]|uniref:calcium/sodium antiporter n=1 Tax=Pleomorphochaeta sp. DL1XJH-081 TaxID=3409690 RepID=UPI003BB494E6
MIIPILAIVIGILILIWSANRFVDGSSALAHHFGMPPLLIGMVIVGFGTSSPEMIVSVQSALQGSPGIALGNAYGSNITNIALILGLTAIISPITVKSRILRNELPLLSLVTILSAWVVYDGQITRWESVLLLALFFLLMGWSVKQGMSKNPDALAVETEESLAGAHLKPKKALWWMLFGLVLLIGSARLLVWGAVDIAHTLGVDDLIIGLTIVAVGTSLPELASSLAAIRKNEHDIALGNVLGSNLFNTLAVVGLAGSIHPMEVGREIFTRDMVVMGTLTLSLFVIGYRFPYGKGRINRFEGILLLSAYIGYTTYLISGLM